MESATKVKIFEDVCVSLQADTLRKDMNPSVLP